MADRAVLVRLTRFLAMIRALGIPPTQCLTLRSGEGMARSLVEVKGLAAVGARSVNAVMIAAYWLIGRYVVELEQEGRSCPEYGKETIERLAADLSAHYGRGFLVRNVWLMRVLYLS